MPPPGSELHDALQVALGNAALIHGRKYRYGAILLSGEDHIPLRSGSNKTLFQRDKIHAEMSALKGFARPAGKDMLIGRLAPVRPPGHRARPASGAGDTDDDDDSDDGCVAEAGRAAGATDDSFLQRSSSSSSGSAAAKILNARPCDRCEARMVAKGIRRCFFTLNRTSIGVIEYNPEEGAVRRATLALAPTRACPQPHSQGTDNPECPASRSIAAITFDRSPICSLLDCSPHLLARTRRWPCHVALPFESRGTPLCSAACAPCMHSTRASYPHA